MRVLVACEYSATVRDAFMRKGHDAWSCDMLESEKGGKHITGDVLGILRDGWDLMVAHPPCQYLSYSARRVWHAPGRAEKREEALKFFIALMEAPIEKICVENPLGLPCQAYRRPDQTIHPYYFGDRVMKRTCLWLKNLAPLIWREHDELFGPRTATEVPAPVRIQASGVNWGKAMHFTEAMKGSGMNRAKERARFFPGIAAAMAEQWG